MGPIIREVLWKVDHRDREYTPLIPGWKLTEKKRCSFGDGVFNSGYEYYRGIYHKIDQENNK